MENYNWDGVIVLVFILYTYMLPPALCIVVQMNIHKYKERFLWLGMVTLFSTLGVIVVTYIEASYISNNIIGGDQYGLLKYLPWATINYILMARQIYLVRKMAKNKNLKGLES